jgi:putative oxidoreductase
MSRPHLSLIARSVSCESFAALLFLQNGLSKLFAFPHMAMFDNLMLFSLLGAAGVIEIVGSLLLLVGPFARPAAFVMSDEMAFAYFMSHAPRGFFPIHNQGELAVLDCFLFGRTRCDLRVNAMLS